jgi:hypothetical protein
MSSRTVVRIPLALLTVGALMISGQTAAGAQTTGTSCSKLGAKSSDATLQCKKVKTASGKVVLRWSPLGAAKAPEPPKGPSKRECFTGQWVESPSSMQTFLRQYVPTMPVQASGQLVYSFDGVNLTASGEMTLGSSDPTIAIAGTVKATGKPFPATYDGIALSMKLAADGDYPRLFDVSLTNNGAAVSIPTGSPGGPAFFPVSCAGNNAWITVQTPRGVVVRVLQRTAG